MKKAFLRVGGESSVAELNEHFLTYIDSLPDKENQKVSIAKFGYAFDIQLQDALAELGMPSAFKNADFSRMCETLLSLDKVIHKTYIEPEEQGTRAEAATVDSLKSTSLPKCDKTVILDRPFVYMIVDFMTGAPIFVGAVTSV